MYNKFEKIIKQIIPNYEDNCYLKIWESIPRGKHKTVIQQLKKDLKILKGKNGKSC